jgi:hypothetical protein
MVQLNTTAIDPKAPKFDATYQAWDWNVNEIIVLITWVIFGCVFFASIFALINKPNKKVVKKLPSDEDTDFGRDSSFYGRKKFGDDEDDDDDYDDEDDLEAGGGRLAKVSGLDVDSDDSSEVGDCKGLGDKVDDLARETEDGDEGPNNVLCETLKAVLAKGLNITLYTVDGPKKIKMFMVGMELRWRMIKIISRKTYKIDLRELEYIEWGKRTAVFQSGPAHNVFDDVCFSLVSNSKTVDLRAASKIERDALAQGFVLLLEEVSRENGKPS